MYFTMVKTVCWYLFSSSRNKEANIGEHLKKAIILSSESVNMLILGVVAAVRVVRNHSRSTPIVFVLYLYQLVSTPLSLLCSFKVATELWMRDFIMFRTVIISVLSFRQFLIFTLRWKLHNFFVLERSFHWWKPLCSICNSLRETAR